MLQGAPVALPPGAPHVIVVGNEKGGVGKTSIAMHAAVGLLKLGQRVSTIDLDSGVLRRIAGRGKLCLEVAFPPSRNPAAVSRRRSTFGPGRKPCRSRTPRPVEPSICSDFEDGIQKQL
jgi:ATPase MipZ